MEELVLVENPEAAEAMTLAAGYRSQGYDPSEALAMGWQEAKGYDNPFEEEELVEYNPFELGEFVEPNPPKRRSTKKAEEGGVSIVLLLGAAVVVWYLVKKEWPWQTLQGIKRKQIAARQAAIAAKKDGLDGVLNPWRVQGTGTVINLPPYNGNESIQLITP